MRRTLAQDAAFLDSRDQRLRWQHQVKLVLVLCDALVVTGVVLLVYFGRFDSLTTPVTDGWALFGGGVLVALWMGVLAGSGAYDARIFAVGTEEFRRILSASFVLFGSVAILSYALKLQLPRSLVALALPLGVGALILERFAVRRWLHLRRRRGAFQHRVVVLGEPAASHHLAQQLSLDPNVGFDVLGYLVPTASPRRNADPLVLGTLEETLDVVREHGVDTIAVTASSDISHDFVRQLSWRLEGSGVDLLVASAVADVAGPRISMRPLAGLPLLYVDEPTLSAWTRVFKRAFDIVISLAALVLLAPLLLVIAVLVRRTSPGPAIFRQERVGRDGTVFTILKFRSMVDGADAQLEAVLAQHGRVVEPLYKVTSDRRVTPLGRVLRRWSLDELPQLVNVLRGDMALVGPRPQRPEEVHHYQDLEPLRLAARPGVTGLWQVSGRSAVSWEEAVRLDLYYVANWSLALDFTILLRTFLAVLRGEGAY